MWVSAQCVDHQTTCAASSDRDSPRCAQIRRESLSRPRAPSPQRGDASPLVASPDSPRHVPDAPRRCAVCMEELVASTLAVRLPCRHTFHEECLRAWLSKHNTCPCLRLEHPAPGHVRDMSAAPQVPDVPREAADDRRGGGRRGGARGRPAAPLVARLPAAARRRAALELVDVHLGRDGGSAASRFAVRRGERAPRGGLCGS